MKYVLSFFLVSACILLAVAQKKFEVDFESDKKPWTTKTFNNDLENFHFAIVTDRTGGHRAGVFAQAIEKLNLLQPEFVMCVGDLIEGYSKNPKEINQQWQAFNDILANLEMRFFYLPGNHDISNQMMREQWIERFGKTYYHFKYGNVLFLAFDSNDGDGVMFGKDQIDYFKQVIQQHTDVQWTLLFMHHPIWDYKEFNGFQEIEDLLKNRPYTVFAGHNHRYLQTTRQNKNYYILATTGGGSRLLGPKFGQFDHITWMTMTKSGPKMINLQLEGLLDHDISNDSTRILARHLMDAANFKYLVLSPTLPTINLNHHKLILNVENKAEYPLIFDGRFYHNHQWNPERRKLSNTINPSNTIELTHGLNEIPGAADSDSINPLELDWSIGYPKATQATPFELTGTLSIPITAEPQHLKFTELDIFFDKHEIQIKHPFSEVLVKYTIDGSSPSFESTTYHQPILLDDHTTIKARYFTKDGQYQSQVFEKKYRMVIPKKPVATVNSFSKGLTYQYFEGNFLVLPDFNELTPKKSGITSDFNIEDIAMRIDHYAILFNGLIEIPSTDIYTFYIRSDDGSKLYIDEELVIDNDGSHSARTEKGYIALEKGKHNIRIEYFEDFLGEELKLFYQSGNSEISEVPFNLLFH